MAAYGIGSAGRAFASSVSRLAVAMETFRMTTPQDIHNLWIEIATKDVGLKIGTNESERALLAGMLYRIRKEMGDPTFDNFVVLMPVDPPTEVWVMRKGMEKGLERYKEKK